MSATPHILNNSRATVICMGNGAGRQHGYDGLTDVCNQQPHGRTAENIAAKYGISRAEQDEFALASEQDEAAETAGKSPTKSSALPFRSARAIRSFHQDEYIKLGATLDGFRRSLPAFQATAV